MPLSPEQEIIARTWVGDEPTNSEMDALYSVLNSWDSVILATLRRKLALLTEQPTNFSVPGLSISNGQQIIALQDVIKKFTSSGGSGLDPEGDSAFDKLQTGRLVRAALR